MFCLNVLGSFRTRVTVLHHLSSPLCFTVCIRVCRLASHSNPLCHFNPTLSDISVTPPLMDLSPPVVSSATWSTSLNPSANGKAAQFFPYNNL